MRARVENAAAALRGSLEANEVHSREIMEQRARMLARPLASDAKVEETLSVVAFEIAGQTFGLEASAVRATVSPREITPLPGLPAFVSGLVNVRSQVLAAFDLRPLLQLPADGGSGASTLLIAHFDNTDFGVLVDRVLPSRQVSANTLRGEVPGLNGKYVRGLAADGLILLELPALCADLVIDDASQP